MNALVQIKVFNNLLKDFLDYLEDNFPLFSSDITLTRSVLNVLSVTNPRVIIEQYMNVVSPHKKEIFDCDEQFFLNFNMNGAKISSEKNLIHSLKIRQFWIDKNTTDKHRAYIWLYFQGFETRNISTHL